MSENHNHEHEDIHDVAHSHEYSHGHEEAHSHEHSHGHEHGHAVASSPEEAVALLRYMLSHNQHHADELHELAHSFDDEIADLVHDAVDSLQDSNSYLEQALSLLDN